MQQLCIFKNDECLTIVLLSCCLSPDTEERARIYSSDSDEGSDDDKAQRLMKAKKLDSDEVGVVSFLTDPSKTHQKQKIINFVQRSLTK